MLTFDDKGGGGVKKPQKPAYVIHGCSLRSLSISYSFHLIDKLQSLNLDCRNSNFKRKNRIGFRKATKITHSLIFFLLNSPLWIDLIAV